MSPQLTPSPSERRAERFRLHHWLQSGSIRGGARRCMHTGRATGEVRVQVDRDGVPHVSGVERCASWACPVCAPTMGERRAREIDQGLATALERGWSVYFVTATVSHKLGDHLADVRSLVHDSWRAMLQGREAQAWKLESGYVGAVRASEVTYGANGWHPHIHAVLIFRGPVGGRLSFLARRFADAVDRRGGVCLWRGPGWDVSAVHSSLDVSSYVCKVSKGWGAGLELARSDLKSARRAGLQPFELLNRATAGDAGAHALWSIYEEATYGKRRIVWSRGLKDLLGVVELSDDDAARSEELADDDVSLDVAVPAPVWDRIRARGELGRFLASIVETAVKVERKRPRGSGAENTLTADKPPDWARSGP